MPSKHTDTFYLWNEIEDEVEKNTNRKLRDWAGKWEMGGAENIPYQDFWHKLIDHTDIENGAVLNIDFKVMADSNPNSPWVREICDEIIKVLGPGEHRIRFDW